MPRPQLDIGLMASLTEAAPGRLVRKLDKDPERAEAWTWTEVDGGLTVTADKAVVTLMGDPLTAPEQVSCNCLLSPRCLHILSVCARLPLAEPADEDQPVEVEPVEITVDVELRPSALQAAAALHATLVELLEAGVNRAGAIAQGQLLRHAHRCRAEKLPRLAGYALRITRAIRALHDRSPDFELPVLASELAGALTVSRRLADGHASTELIGVSRRRYDTLGGLRLTGLFCEPVVTTSGYAGVVTTLVGPDGRLFTVSDVRPGPAERAKASYLGGAGIGASAVSHADLCRSGLMVSRATASAGGRLGRGKDVQAVASKTTEWPSALFDVPLKTQVERALARGAEPVEHRPEGADLVFVHASFDRGNLVVEGKRVPWRVASDLPAVRFRENARLLASARAETRLIARFSRGWLMPLAISPLEGLRLDPELRGRLNLGFDRLVGSDLVERSVPDIELPPAPLGTLHRRIARVVLGGARAMPASAGADVHRDAARLRSQLLETGADLLIDLHHAAGRGPRGTRGSGTPERLAEAFSRAVLYATVLEQRRLALLF